MNAVRYADRIRPNSPSVSRHPRRPRVRQAYHGISAGSRARERSAELQLRGGGSERVRWYMLTSQTSPALARLFSELVDGAGTGGAFILNSGDVGLLRSLDRVSAADASRSTNGGATIAAHAQHLRYGLSLMNRWAAEGGNPFADARWDEAWKITTVDESAWRDIQRGLADETHRWLTTLASPRDASDIEVTGMIASVAHLAYHLGAIRQISRETRGPREGTFS